MTTQSCKKFYFVNSADCFAIEPQPLDFVFPGFLAGIVNGLVSPSGVEKSTFGLEICIAVACSFDAPSTLLC